MLSVVIPAFNAARHIEDRLLFLSSALRRMELESELIVVDDGSTDDTWDIIERSAVRGIRLDSNSGKFAAIRTGVREMRGQCCVFTDSDVPFDPAVMRLMVELTVRKGFHVAVGDRTLPASEYDQEVGLTRRIATRAFRDAVRLLVTGELPDTQCGIKGFRGDVAKVLFSLLQEDRFAGDVELLYVSLKYNLAIRRVPVRLIHQGSTSVRPFRDGVEMLTQIARLRRRYRRGVYESPELRRIVEESMSHSGRVFR